MRLRLPLQPIVLFLTVAALNCRGGKAGIGDERQKTPTGEATQNQQANGQANQANPSHDPAHPNQMDQPGEDQADTPVLITGTYLTCNAVAGNARSAATESDSNAVAYGCRVADQKTKETIHLKRFAQEATWTYSLSASHGANVKVTPTKGGLYQVVYVFRNSSQDAQIAALQATVILNIKPRPESDPTGQMQSLRHVLGTILEGGDPITSLDEIGLEDGLATLPPVTTTLSEASPEPSLGLSPEPSSAVTLSTPDPTVTPGKPGAQFSLAAAGGGQFNVAVAFVNTESVTDVAVTSKGELSIGATILQGDGSATFDWQLPLHLTFRSEGKACLVEATLTANAGFFPASCL